MGEGIYASAIFAFALAARRPGRSKDGDPGSIFLRQVIRAQNRDGQCAIERPGQQGFGRDLTRGSQDEFVSHNKKAAWKGRFSDCSTMLP
jgi:hypothetical protein